MPLKGLSAFQYFNLEEFLRDKRLLFLKAIPWIEQGQEMGSKAVLQIIEDRTPYKKPDINNFGEQITVKVRSLAPNAFAKLKPLATEVVVTDIEKAALFGEYRNQLSIIASVSVKGT